MYENTIRQAILSSKWSVSTVGIESLAAFLAEERREELAAFGADRIVPIPQSWRARLQRRFNAASQIATVLSRALHIPVDEHVLRRSRHSRPQKRVAVQQRFDNQKGSFRIRDAHVVSDANILIVDDVLTTGATCSEAARVLKRHGAAHCSVAVIARVLDYSG